MGKIEVDVVISFDRVAGSGLVSRCKTAFSNKGRGLFLFGALLKGGRTFRVVANTGQSPGS